ncbi:hypothetical protein OG749_02630 [Streptomyces nojiriensis]|uniref:hypothetical protein n=1 Tax=Streptomyces nojiriensis TaxID=66374 RepID=UPI002E189C80
MDTSLVAEEWSLAPLLHDLANLSLTEWVVALIAAIIAALAVEVAAKMMHKITARLPFLVLRLTWFLLPSQDWKHLYHKVWEPDLHDVLTKPTSIKVGGPILRYFKALGFAILLVLGGAVRMNLQLSPETRARQVSYLRGLGAAAFVASVTAVAFWAGWLTAFTYCIAVIDVLMGSRVLIKFRAATRKK